MTEKRFNVVYLSELGVDAIKDNNTGKHLPLNNERICNLLNTLNDENEQLKKDCTALISHNQEYRKENEQLKNVVGHNYEEHKRCVNNYVNKIKEVEKENEQLKSENRQLKGRLMEYEEQIKGDDE